MFMEYLGSLGYDIGWFGCDNSGFQLEASGGIGEVLRVVTVQRDCDYYNIA